MNDDRARRLTLAATALGSALAFIDASVVVVALPTIEQDLNFGLAGEQWVFLAYSLALAALYLPAGAVGDRAGRRETFIAGVAGFALASALAGAAPTGGVLIVARRLAGSRGAFVSTNSLALLRETYGRESGRAVGLWTAFTSAATIIGPPLGGVIVEWVSWRWIFFINLPLAAATIVLAHRGRCPQREVQRVGHLDLPGAALAAIGFGALTYGMVEGADRGFGSYWWAFAVSGAALAAFVGRRAAQFASRCCRSSSSAGATSPFRTSRRCWSTARSAATSSIFTIYLQFLGFSPLVAGLVNVPPSIVLVVLSSRFGRLADERGPRLFLTVGPVLIGGGLDPARARAAAAASSGHTAFPAWRCSRSGCRWSSRRSRRRRSRPRRSASPASQRA